jgi:heme/copper-type cytochrome/quinol oxidase subunit 2
MSTPLSVALFTLAALAIVIAQVMILRSTRRGMRHGPRGASSVLEWTYAVLPALALIVMLAWTWRTMRENVVHFELRPGASGPIS